jgi:hypothetical protein
MGKVRDHKSLVAKLLATENITVRYDKVSTAAFSPVKRELILPIYKTELSDDELDLFIGHEVGHALFTPAVDPSEYSKGRNNFHGVLNVVEDARIERLIQDKFPGLKRNFSKGYKDLVDRKFFGDVNPNDLGFVDRLNLYFKLGDNDIVFDEEEMQFVEEIENCKTFEEVLDITERIYSKFSQEKKEKEEQQSEGGEDENNEESVPESGSGDSGESTDQDGDPEDNEESAQSTESDEGEDDTEDSGNGESTDDDVRDDNDDGTSTEERNGLNSLDSDDLSTSTQDSLERSMEDMVETSEYFKYREVNLPTQLDHVVPNRELVEIVNNHSWKRNDGSVQDWTEVSGRSISNVEQLKEDFLKFSKEQKSVINYMVKEFEMRKSADEYKRTRESKTGSLNLNKLHQYKFSEDLFRKNLVVKDGKNHGLIMYIDWSGSMCDCIGETIEQLQVLIMFCKKVNIPFEVYAFTNHWVEEWNYNTRGFSGNNLPYTDELHYDKSYKLLELCNTSLNTKEYNESMYLLEYLKLCRAGAWAYKYSYPSQLYLGGTPISPTVFSSIQQVKNFRKRYNLQIVNAIFLTDGEGNDQILHVNENGVEGKINPFYSKNSRTVIRGDVKDYVVNVDGKYLNWWNSEGEISSTEELGFDILKTECPYTNVIGFFVSEPRDIGRNVAMHSINPYESVLDNESRRLFMRKNTKQNFLHFNKGIKYYDDLFVTMTTNLRIDNDDWEVDESTRNSKVKLRTSFIKKMNKKNNSRSFLKKFTEIIA